MSTLRSVTGKFKARATWCGPAAVSVITGEGYDQVIDLMKAISGRSSIKGVSNSLMWRCLGHLGYEVKRRGDPTPSPTLARWLKMRDNPNATYLVNVTQHYVVVKGRKIVDNRTMGPVFLREYKHRRSRVQIWWEVTKKE